MSHFAGAGCAHTTRITVTDSELHECPECVAMGDRWVHLRMCLDCGHVGCCDSSKNRHATAHHRASGHAVIRSIEPGEAWVWCYVDQAVVGEMRA